MKKNQEIRELIAEKRIFYYEIAETLGISPVSFTLWMRTELTPERKQRTLKAIEQLTQKK